ncbi:MAG: diguanylate cyclase [Vicinamibacterales bacterium]
MSDSTADVQEFAGSPIAVAPARLPLDRWSIGIKLLAGSMLALVAIGAVSVVSLRVIARQRTALAHLTTLSRTQRILQDADMMHDTVRADVLALLLDNARSFAPRGSLDQRLRRDIEGYRLLITQAQAIPIPDDLRQAIADIQPELAVYLNDAGAAMRLEPTDGDGVSAALAAFQASFEALAEANERLTNVFAERVLAANAEADAAASAGLRAIALACALAVLVVAVAGRLVSRSVATALARVRDAAGAIARGDLSVRSAVPVQDDVGAVATAVNQMADTLQTMIGRLQQDQVQDAFSRQLSEVLDMADTEGDTYAVVARGMEAVSRDMAMELLVADSSRAHLERATVHPGLGAPGCTVESPYGCMAVRRGNPISFETSDALNACSRLRDRECGAVSAVCVPLSFMGRALGVLHATGRAWEPPSAQIVSQLTTLGILAGSRIGTVRAFERTQVQASTDVLTGLLNRRSVESRVRKLAPGRPYAVLLADLDHFKRLNDTHGHEAGDQALKVFADVLRRSLREGDIIGRWGGEEFLVVLDGRDALFGFEVVDRIRGNLSAACQIKGIPTVTASFGIADSTMATTFDQQVRIADDALYQSKEAGRDRGTIGDALRVAKSVPRRDAEHLASMNLAALQESEASQGA